MTSCITKNLPEPLLAPIWSSQPFSCALQNIGPQLLFSPPARIYLCISVVHLTYTTSCVYQTLFIWISPKFPRFWILAYLFIPITVPWFQLLPVERINTTVRTLRLAQPIISFTSGVLLILIVHALFLLIIPLTLKYCSKISDPLWTKWMRFLTSTCNIQLKLSLDLRRVDSCIFYVTSTLRGNSFGPSTRTSHSSI